MDQPLHEHLAELFLARIHDGTWPEGEPIASETALCRELGVSRGPVRQALASLRRQGVLVGGQGRPPRVTRTTPSQPVTVFVSFSAWATAAGLEPGQRTLEIARRRADADAASHLGIDPGDPVVTVLRVRTLRGEPVMLERTTWVDAIGRHLLDMDLDAGSAYAHLTARGVDLFAATHVLDAVAADTTDAELLGVAPGSPLLRERRTTVDSAGTAVEHADDRYLPDRANFVVHNRRSAQGAFALVDPTSTASTTTASSTDPLDRTGDTP